MTIETYLTIDLGNNESNSVGIIHEANGTFTAFTLSRSRKFKTLAGARRWLARCGY